MAEQEEKDRLFGKRRYISPRIGRLLGCVLLQMHRWGMGNASFDRCVDRPVGSLVESVRTNVLTFSKARSGLFAFGIFFKNNNCSAPA